MERVSNARLNGETTGVGLPCKLRKTEPENKRMEQKSRANDARIGEREGSTGQMEQGETGKEAHGRICRADGARRSGKPGKNGRETSTRQFWRWEEIY